VRYAQRTLFGESISVRTCDVCGGSGEVPDKACHTCKGKKKVKKKKKIQISIPEGVDNGSILSLRGEGDLGTKGGPRGDVHIVIRVLKHKIFTRDGNDLYQELHISFAHASLGGEVKVPTLDGKVKYHIEPGTQSGTVFRLKSKGMPVMDSYGKGDMYVKLIVDIPKKLDDQQRAALRTFAVAMGEELSEENKGFFGKMKNK
jgi:molecular chaperone DnaJ